MTETSTPSKFRPPTTSNSRISVDTCTDSRSETNGGSDNNSDCSLDGLEVQTLFCRKNPWRIQDQRSSQYQRNIRNLVRNLNNTVTLSKVES